jgi:hypothetical protein
VGVVVLAPSDKAGRKAEAATGNSGAGARAGEGAVIIDGGAGRKAGAAGQPTEQEQTGSPPTCKAEQSKSLLLLLSLSNRRN